MVFFITIKTRDDYRSLAVAKPLTDCSVMAGMGEYRLEREGSLS
jgi:hypothetical protein